MRLALFAGGPRHGQIHTVQTYLIVVDVPPRVEWRKAGADDEVPGLGLDLERHTYRVKKLLMFGHVLRVAVTDATTDTDVLKAMAESNWLEVAEHCLDTNEVQQA